MADGDIALHGAGSANGDIVLEDGGSPPVVTPQRTLMGVGT